MDHVKRRLSSSSNNVSNMHLDGVMGIPPGLRIRIRIGSRFNRVSGSGSRRAKMTHKSRKKFSKYILKCWMASFES
jgi:hypothetical protein